jgi:hypothetical protein
MKPLRYLTEHKDQFGRNVYRTDIPMHNCVAHTIAWDVHGWEKREYIVYAEAPGWVPDEATHVGALPGEVEVWREEFDMRVDRDRTVESERTAGHLYGDWNIWEIRECPCGCTERKREGVKALKRAARYAETAAEHDRHDIPTEDLRLSPQAQILAEDEAQARGVTVLCVVEVALRYMAVDLVLDVDRYSLLPFSAAEEATVRASLALGMPTPLSADALKAISWAERGLRGLTRANAITRAVELFAALPQKARDSEWRFHTEDIVDE